MPGPAARARQRERWRIAITAATRPAPAPVEHLAPGVEQAAGRLRFALAQLPRFRSPNPIELAAVLTAADRLLAAIDARNADGAYAPVHADEPNPHPHPHPQAGGDGPLARPAVGH